MMVRRANERCNPWAQRMTETNAVPGGLGPPGTHARKSEGYSPCKLNHARQIVLAGHLAHRSSPAGRRIKLRSVKQVEELTPELEAESTVRTELRVLESGEV